MAGIEHLRDRVTAPPAPEYWQSRTSEGWRLTGVVWERPATTGETESLPRAEVPYGLRVADDCLHLEEEPRETEVLARMLRMIADDHSLSEVARALNEAGFRSRSGGPWTQGEAFELLPRLIDAAPAVRTSAVFRGLTRATGH